MPDNDSTIYTVRELLDYLQQFPPNAQVVLSLDDTKNEDAVSLTSFFDSMVS